MHRYFVSHIMLKLFLGSNFCALLGSLVPSHVFAQRFFYIDGAASEPNSEENRGEHKYQTYADHNISL